MMYSIANIASIILVVFWLWARMEKALDRRNLRLYRPVPIPNHCTYTPDQVSVIVCTVDTLLVRSLRTWLLNNPLEVIIVTIAEHKDTIKSLVANASLSHTDFAKITILVSPTKSKRPQLDVGIRQAKGSIIATVDDHINWHPNFLKGMLPALEDKNVGAVGSTCTPVIPTSRQHSDIITPWEVAATRVAWNRNPQLKASYAAAKWCWILGGFTCVFRAHIIKDPFFLHGYLNDSWSGKKLDSGEDTFISRWLQSHGWTIAIQALPETDVLRTFKTTPDFLKQMFRWERSMIRSHIHTIFEVPQIYQSFFVARKTWGRLLRPVLTTFHILAWIAAMICGGWVLVLALILIVWYACEFYPSYRDFFAEYPYMRRYWWAVVGQDFFYIVQDYVCWVTLSDTTWEAKKVTVEDQIA